jgi:nicotinamidase-related amidase
MSAALLFIDVINHFEFPDGGDLLRNALPIAPRLRNLKQRARAEGVPTIYVNDNFGRWRSDFAQVLERCMSCGPDVKSFIEQVVPDKEDYILLKPKHSAFYYTPLELLLRNLKADHLILTGLATNSCVLCSAHDANMRDLTLAVPSDCCAARSRGEHDVTIAQLAEMLEASTAPSTDPRFSLSPPRANDGSGGHP